MPGRGAWTGIAVAAVVVAAIGVGSAVYLAGSGAEPTASATPKPTSTPSAVVTEEPEGFGIPSTCSDLHSEDFSRAMLDTWDLTELTERQPGDEDQVDSSMRPHGPYQGAALRAAGAFSDSLSCEWRSVDTFADPEATDRPSCEQRAFSVPEAFGDDLSAGGMLSDYSCAEDLDGLVCEAGPYDVEGGTAIERHFFGHGVWIAELHYAGEVTGGIEDTVAIVSATAGTYAPADGGAAMPTACPASPLPDEIAITAIDAATEPGHALAADALRELLSAGDPLRCEAAGILGYVDDASFAVMEVTDAQAGDVRDALVAQGLACVDVAEATVCTVTGYETDASGSYVGEVHVIRDGLWISDAWAQGGPGEDPIFAAAAFVDGVLA